MRIRDLKFQPFITVDAKASVLDAIRHFGENPDHSILIVGDGGFRFLNADIILRGLNGMKAIDKSLGSIGLPRVECLSPEMTMSAAAKLFLKQEVERLPVVSSSACLGFVAWHQVYSHRPEEEQILFNRQLLHDIRSPLSIIDFSADSLLGKDAAEQERIVEKISRSVGKVKLIAESVLDLARSRNLSDLPEIKLRECLPDFISELKWIGEGAKRVSVYLADCPNCVVNADPVLLNRAIQNLVDNAVKHSPAGGTVLVDVAYCGSSSNTVRISVKDEGPGVPEEVREKIFDLFTTFSPAQQHGYGIGLTLARDIAGVLGGRIVLDSSKLGSCFSLELPCSKKIEVPTSKRRSASDQPTVLLVDDDDDLLGVVSRKLAGSGYTVFTAIDGTEARQTLEKDSIDVVVTDIRMPRCNGFELAEGMIASDPENSATVY